MAKNRIKVRTNIYIYKKNNTWTSIFSSTKLFYNISSQILKSRGRVYLYFNIFLLYRYI